MSSQCDTGRLKKIIPAAMIAMIAATSMSAVNPCGNARRWRDRKAVARFVQSMDRDTEPFAQVNPLRQALKDLGL